MRGKLFRALIPCLLLTGLLCSCATSPSATTITVDRLPAWRAPEGQEEIKVKDLVAEIHRRAPGVQVRWEDNVYKRISYVWLEEYLHWTWKTALEHNVTYASESYDCEEFSLAFYLLASRAASLAGQKPAPLIGRMVATQDYPFAGIPAVPGKKHELIIVATDRGVFVVEPQTQSPHRLVPLAQYPNRILKIVFSD